MPGEFVCNPPYFGADISEVNGVRLPQSYLDFMKEQNGGEGDIGETWFVLFRLEELKELNDAYGFAESLPGCVIIGSNGADEFYGINAAGQYFNVPALFDEDDITVLCDDFSQLANAVNAFWKSL